MRRMSCLLIRMFFALMLVSAVGNAPAEDFPTKPIRIILPSLAGGPTDFYARAVAQGLTENLGQQVLVVNYPGASGIIGTDMVAKAPPDGYTLLLTSTHHSVNPSLYKKLPYDTVNDFTPLTLVAMNPNVLVAHPSLSAISVKELIVLAKARPGQLNYASTSGIGGGNHLSAELLKSMAGIDILHIPYKGQSAALNDLVAGHVTLMFTSVGLMVPYIKAGKLKALAVTGAKRLASLPDVPTVAETLPGYEVNSWWGMWSPARTPKNIVNRLNTEIARVLNSPDVKKRFLTLDAEAGGNAPEEFAAFQKSEMDRWARVVKSLGLQLEANYW
jgi:tripartite-type tricarboxylate transporter receptor subunit TctC